MCYIQMQPSTAKQSKAGSRRNSFLCFYICNRICEQRRVGAKQPDFAWSISLCSLSLRDKAPSHEQADTTPGGFSFCFICTNLTAGLFCNLCLLATNSQWRYSTINCCDSLVSMSVYV